MEAILNKNFSNCTYSVIFEGQEKIEMRMKKIFSILAGMGLMLLPCTLQSAENVSGYDILHYRIALDIDFQNEKVQGHTTIRFRVEKDQLETLYVALSDMTVDSVTYSGRSTGYQYRDSSLEIRLSPSASRGDTLEVTVFYRGTPAQDPSGWGGFYFKNGYAFNLGVGFEVNPHPFGRAWFPCFDNFTGRATYSFYITVPPGKKAFCNGLLKDTVHEKNGRITWHWELKETIPTYLASVAAGDYATVKFDHTGIRDTIPVMYGAKASDTVGMKASFRNIHKGIDVFEKLFGPHRFSRIGFNLVPFSGGAMEHATNIAMPRAAGNGNLTYETLWAHELSHHWWGDLATCRSAADMWLNEGWATYSEMLFLEEVYGKKAYTAEVQSNHQKVLKLAHIRDQGAFPLTPVPHDITYGMHVYNKGAGVLHTLRKSYLGDSLFFPAVRKYLEKTAFQSYNTQMFRDSLMKYTGKDLEPFFSNWVFSPGFPHFSLGPLEVTREQSAYLVKGKIWQKLRFAPEYYREVPLEVYFFDSEGKMEVKYPRAGERSTGFQYTLPFRPVVAVTDIYGKISDARNTEFQIIRATGSHEFSYGMMNLNVNEITDSALMIIQHHWIAPDYFKRSNPGIRISDYRYWSVNGVWPEVFKASAVLRYDGPQFLDHTLDIQNEDSLVLLYRKGPAGDWYIYNDYELVTVGNKTDQKGFIRIQKLKKGEYCLGVKDPGVIGIKKPQEQKRLLTVYPNPAGNKLTVISHRDKGFLYLSLYDLQGKLLDQWDFEDPRSRFTIDISAIPAGTYLLKAKFPGKGLYRHKFMIEKL